MYIILFIILSIMSLQNCILASVYAAVEIEPFFTTSLKNQTWKVHQDENSVFKICYFR